MSEQLTMPRDVTCPTCGAAIDWPCKTSGGYRAKTHAKRWQAIGISKPDLDQMHAAYTDGIGRDIELSRKADAANLSPTPSGTAHKTEVTG